MQRGAQMDPRPVYSAARGVAVVLLLSVAATALGRITPILGAATLGLLLGVLARNSLGIGSRLTHVIRAVVDRALKLAIILLGATLTLQQALSLGWTHLGLIFVTVTIGLLSAIFAGRYLRIPIVLSWLIGVGTAICGATAIVTLAPALRGKNEEVSYALTTVFIFNLLAMISYPFIGHALALSEAAFGVWTGVAIHDTSSVLAASFEYGDVAGATATVVKITRTLFLIPIAVLLPLLLNGPAVARSDLALRPRIPLFIIGFLIMSLLASLGLITPQLSADLGSAVKVLIVIGLVAVGLGTDTTKIQLMGPRAFFVGLAASIAVALFSLAVASRLH